MAAETEPKKQMWHSYKWWGVAVGAIFILLVVFLGGVAADRLAYGPGGEHFKGNHMHRGAMKMRGGMGGVPGSGQFLDNSQNKVHGTVTSVNGDTFTVAGNGATTQVKTSSSTSYVGGNQVKVNDSVGVAGTLSGDTIQATKIIVNPGR